MSEGNYNLESIRARFSAAAAAYDRHAHIQRRVVERLIVGLAELPEPGDILEAGCGSGQLTRRLLQRFPHARIDAMDLSGRMIDEARKRVPDASRIRWRVDDIRRFVPDALYGLIVSSSSLHWADPLTEALQNLKHALAPEGLFVAAIMLEGTLQELHRVRRSVAPHKVPPGRLPAFQEVERALHHSGFEVFDDVEEPYRAEYTSARDFLRCIHEQGLTGGLVSRAERPLTRRELRQLTEEYDARYALESGGVYATYHVGYFKARALSASPL